MIGFVAAITVVVLVHELGHLLAARAVGHRIFEVQIGVGPALVFDVGGTVVRLAAIPFGGHIQSASPDLRRFRRRAAIVAGAGCVANLVTAVVAVVLWWPVLASVSVVAALVNLWPTTRRARNSASDGRVLLDLVRGADEVAEERSAWWSATALRHRDRHEPDAAEAAVDEGFRRVGHTHTLRAIAGLLAYEQGRYGTAAEHYAHLVDAPHLSKKAQAGFAADAAWAAYLDDAPHRHGDVLPWAQWAEHTRSTERRRLLLGLALADAGYHDDARSIVAGDGIPAHAIVDAAVSTALGDTAAAGASMARAGLAADHPIRLRLERRTMA